jgi:hypothetical protein
MEEGVAGKELHVAACHFPLEARIIETPTETPESSA